MEHLLSCNRKNPGKMKIIITPIVIPLKSFNVLNSFMKTASPIANMKKTIVAGPLSTLSYIVLYMLYMQTHAFLH